MEDNGTQGGRTAEDVSCDKLQRVLPKYKLQHSSHIISRISVVSSVTSGIQNITELSDWRKEHTTVIKWIEANEKKLTALGEPGDQHKDLSNKCTTLDVSTAPYLPYSSDRSIYKV